MTPHTTSDSAYVQSLARGLSVITSFDADRRRQSLTQVAENTGLARATARRFLHTLVGLGYAGTDGAEFWLTPRILELGYSYVSSQELPDISQPHMESLSATLGESSSLSVLDGTDVVYIGRVPVRRIMSVNINIGTRFPAHATSMGRTLLAGLPPDELDDYFAAAELTALTSETADSQAELRQAIATVADVGYSVVDQELEPGLRSVAAPIVDSAGRTVAAINVSTHSAGYTLETLQRHVIPAVRQAAREISSDYISTQHL